MNHIYKVVWSKVKNCYVVVSEIAHNSGKEHSSRTSHSHRKGSQGGLYALALAIALGLTSPSQADADDPGNGTSATYDAKNNLVVGKNNDTKLTDTNGNPITDGQPLDTTENTKLVDGEGQAHPLTKSTEFSGSDSIAVGAEIHNAGSKSIIIGNNAKITSTPVTYYVDKNGNKTTNKKYAAWYKDAYGNPTKTVPQDPNQLYTVTLYQVVSNAVAIGNGAQASGDSSIALGNGAVAEGKGATGIGQYAKATGDYATAFGGLLSKDRKGNLITYTNTASGKSATAFGQGAQARGNASLAFGLNTIAGQADGSGQQSVAFGENTQALGGRSVAFGENTIANYNDSVAFGNDTRALSTGATAFGNRTRALSSYSTAWGNATVAADEESTAWGSDTIAGAKLDDNGAVTNIYTYKNNPDDKNEQPKTATEKMDVHGNLAYIQNGSTVGVKQMDIGGNTEKHDYVVLDGQDGNTYVRDYQGSLWRVTVSADGKTATVDTTVGDNGKVYNNNSRAGTVGSKTTTTVNGTEVAITPDSVLKKAHEGSNGYNIDGYKDATAFGYSTEASGDYATAFGNDTQAKATGATTFGTTTKASGDNATAFGLSSTASGKQATAFGSSSTASGDNATAFGESSTASGEASTAFGISSTASGKNSLAALGGTASAENAAAIGNGAQATLIDSVALGSNSKTTRAKYSALTDAKEKAAYAKGSTSTGSAWEATDNAIAVGNDSTTTRQITGVAAGSLDTDAVNVAQLRAVDAKHTIVTVGGNSVTADNTPVNGGNLDLKRTTATNGQETYDLSLDKNVILGEQVENNGGKLTVNNVDKFKNYDKDGKPLPDTTVKEAVKIDGKTVSVVKHDGSAADNDQRQVVLGVDQDAGGYVALYDNTGRKPTYIYNAISGGITYLKDKNSYLTPDLTNPNDERASNEFNRLEYGDYHTGTIQFIATLDDGQKYAGDNYEAAETETKTVDGKTTTTVTKEEQNVLLKKLNERLDIKGGATGALTDKNIGVNVKDSVMKVQLAQNIDLGDQGSVKMGNTTINKDGVTITPTGVTEDTKKISLTDKGLSNGGKTITNVADGKDGSDAVNVSQLNAAKTTVTSNDHSVTVIPDNNASDKHTNYDLKIATATLSQDKTGSGDSAVATGKVSVANPTYTEDGKTVTNENAYVTGNSVKDAINNSGFTLTTSKSDGGSVDGVTKTLIKPGSTVTLDAGKNIALTQAGSKVTIALSDDVTVQTITANGKNGNDGEIGLTGKNGADGKVTTIIKTIGKNGTDGKDGKPGINGTDGITRIVYQDGKDSEAGTTTHTVATLDDGLKFIGDKSDDTAIAKKLGATLTIKGDGTYDATTKTNTGNIQTSVDDGAIKVALNKDINLKQNGSLTVGGNTQDGSTTGQDPILIKHFGAGDLTVTGTDKDGKTPQSAAGDYVTGLDNKDWNVTNPTYVSGRAATEDQLKKISDEIKKNATTASEHTEITVNDKNNPTTVTKIGTGTYGDYDGTKDGNLLIAAKKDTDSGKTIYNIKLNDQLAIGQKGEQGQPGTPGKDGKFTVETSKGTTVVIGHDGEPGKDGKDGLFVTGKDGKSGVSITGPNGATGTDGVDGKVGIAGKDGKDAVSIAGRDGIGHIGLTGQKGEDGKDGVFNDLSTILGTATLDPAKNEQSKSNDTVSADDKSSRIQYQTTVTDKDANTKTVITHEVATMDDGLKFAGDDVNTTVAKKLNSTLQIRGDGTYDKEKNTVADDGNIKTSVDNDAVKVSLSDKINLHQDGYLTVGGDKNGDAADGNDPILIKNFGAGDLTVTGRDKDGKTPQSKAGDYVTGLDNKDWDVTNPTYVSGRAATEDQLKAISDAVNKAASTAGEHTVVTVNDKDSSETTASVGTNGKYGSYSDSTKGNLLIASKDENGKTTYNIKLNDQLAIGQKGEKGEQGQPGTPGKDGKVTVETKGGTTVVIGHDGMDGDNGKDGLFVTGKDGKDGKSGVSITGPDGVAGKDKDGVNGKVGITGEDGKDAVSISGTGGVGHIGLTGPKGEKGADGTPGKDGISIDITTDLKSATLDDGKNVKTVIKDKDDKETTIIQVPRIQYDSNGKNYEVATMDDGLKIGANAASKEKAANPVSNKLNSTINIMGSAAKTGHTYTDDNLTTTVEQDPNGNTTVKVLMDKDITGNSVTVGEKGEKGESGTPGKDGVDGTIGVNGKDGSSVVIKGQDGISINGKDGQNGVTIKGVDCKAGTEGHIGLIGPKGPKGADGKDGQNASADIHVKNGQVGVDGTDGNKGTNGMDRVVYEDHNHVTHEVATMGDGLKFAGDDAHTTVAKKLNETLQIRGDGTYDKEKNTVAEDGNIKTSVDNGAVKVSLSDKINLHQDGYLTVGGSKNGNAADGNDPIVIKHFDDKTLDVITGVDKEGKPIIAKEGKAGDYVTGLDNKNWNVDKPEYVSGRAATEDQLKTISDAVKEAATTAGKHTVITVENGKAAGTTDYNGENLKLKVTDEDGQKTYDLKLNDKVMLGKAGKDGVDGSIGLKGADGKSSIGLNGKDGISVIGKDGQNGVSITGSNGLNGKDGIDGKIAIGMPGKDGQPGKDAVSISGKDGVGHIGLTGQKGADGKDGAFTDLSTILGTATLDRNQNEVKDKDITKDKASRIQYQTTVTTEDGKTKTITHEVATMDDGLKFVGNDGKEIAKKLNSTMSLTGGMDKDAVATASSKNLGVRSNANGDGLELVMTDTPDFTKVTVGEGTDTTQKIIIGKQTVTGKKSDGTAGTAETGKYITGLDNTKWNKDNVVENRAATEGQLRDVAGSITNQSQGGGFGLADEAGNTVKKDLGQTVTVKGDGKNIETKVANGALEVSLKKDVDLGGNGSINAGQTKVDQNGVDTNKVTIKDSGINISKDGINGGGKQITNIASGIDGKTYADAKDNNAASIGDVKNIAGKVEQNVTNVTENVNQIGQHVDKIQTDVTQLQQDVKADRQYQGDDAATKKSVNVKFGRFLSLTGGAKVEALADEGNLGVIQQEREDPDHKGEKLTGLSIRLAKDLKGLNSVEANTVNAKTVNSETFQAGNTTINNGGLTVKGDDTHKDITVQQGTVNMGGNKIEGVAPGKVAPDSTDAVNGSQLAQRDQAIGKLGGEVSSLDRRVDRVGAGAAALAALHPQDFDPDDKWDFAVGYGNYRGANAAAVGAFYRPNEDTTLSVGGTVGGGENMVNAGISFKFGQGNHVTNSRVAMAKEILALKDYVQKQDEKIEQLEALVGQQGTAAAPKRRSILFPDVPENHWAYVYVKKLADRGLLEGYPDGEFKGDRTITRYEFAAIFSRALENGASVDNDMERMSEEFEPEIRELSLNRFRVDRVEGKDNDRHKIERVRVNDRDELVKQKNGEQKKRYRDLYGSVIEKDAPADAAK